MLLIVFICEGCYEDVNINLMRVMGCLWEKFYLFLFIDMFIVLRILFRGNLLVCVKSDFDIELKRVVNLNMNMRNLVM